MHKFRDSLAVGKDGEAVIVDFFKAKWPHFDWQPAGIDDDLAGIDGYLVSREKGKTLSVQIKTDKKSAETGNAFIEDISKGEWLDSAQPVACLCGRRLTRVIIVSDIGWVWSATANHLYYYFPHLDEVYVINPNKLRLRIRQDWSKKYKLTPSDNGNYLTFGWLIPIPEFRELAERIYKVSSRELIHSND